MFERHLMLLYWHTYLSISIFAISMNPLKVDDLMSRIQKCQ